MLIVLGLFLTFDTLVRFISVFLARTARAAAAEGLPRPLILVTQEPIGGVLQVGKQRK